MTPIPKIQPVIGSNNTKSIPRPKPIIHTPNVFFNMFIAFPPFKKVLPTV
jgi:hypothetical protein